MVEAAIQPDDVHRPHSSLVSLENTSNRGGGSCYEMDEIKKIKKVCKEHKLALHLDGARLFNAIVAKKQSPKEYGEAFDSISVCLSKSLGCPVGSVLIGSRDMIKKARRIRKVFGGGMRQAGFLAAAGIYALDHNIERLSEDHEHTGKLAGVIKNKSFVKTVLPVETNIVIFELNEGQSAPAMVAKLREQSIYAYAISPNRIRLVVHLDISSEMIDRTIETFEKLN
jgi:threonine aldolase